MVDSTTPAGTWNRLATVRMRAVLLLNVGLLTIAGASADEIHGPRPGHRIKVFLCAGQSNMEGRADGKRLTQNDRDRLQQVQTRVQLAFNHRPVAPLDIVKPPENIARHYGRDMIFGPELFFGITMAEAWPQEQFLIIKRSSGGTSLHGCWNPDWQAHHAELMDEQNDTPLYADLVSWVPTLLAGLDSDEYEVCGMLWVQGETDAQNPIAAREYGTNLSNLVRCIRRDTGKDSFPFLLFEVGDGLVVEGMRRVAHDLPHVSLLPQSLVPDSPEFYEKMENGHYDYAGMKKLGRKFALEFLQQSAPNGQ